VFADEANNFPKGLACGRCEGELIESEDPAVVDDDEDYYEHRDRTGG
jgi:hypothetical protein